MTYLNNQSSFIAQAEELVAENPRLSEEELISKMYNMYINNTQQETLGSTEEGILTSYTDDAALTNNRKYNRGLELTEEHIDELLDVIKTAVKFALRLKNKRD